ncbi:MAG TPA: hypothetical protein VH661_05360 [Candidatus Dormibacteraeota bacterium]|nr:hypothetical protein [Candidatus Dormibacteraeota bacterium]
MNADTSAADGDPGMPAADADAPRPPRPWSIAAAMEPVPPLAPPPALPGQGVVVATTPRPVEGAPGPRTLIAFAALLAAVAIIVVVLLVIGR